MRLATSDESFVMMHITMWIQKLFKGVFNHCEVVASERILHIMQKKTVDEVLVNVLQTTNISISVLSRIMTQIQGF